MNDLFRPNPVIYWADFLLSVIVGGACFFTVRRWQLVVPQPWATFLSILSFSISVVAFYRASLFTHELVHLREKSFVPFRIAWNLLCGFPFLIPSFTYYTHVRHHVRRLYGTKEDGEYLALAAGPRWKIFAYLAEPFLMPVAAVIRFGILTPLAWASPRLRRWIYQHASAMVIDPSFIRPLPTRGELGIWRLQETCCFLLVLVSTIVLASGRAPLAFIPQAYLTSVGVLMLNHVRTLGAHRYRHRRQEVSFLDQLLDSVNYPPELWTAELWAPVGLRYHALHHLFPSLPYHNLGKAHRRLMEQLPADSPYRQTVCPNLPTAIRDLWREAGSKARQPAMRPPIEEPEVAAKQVA